MKKWKVFKKDLNWAVIDPVDTIYYFSKWGAAIVFAERLSTILCVRTEDDIFWAMHIAQGFQDILNESIKYTEDLMKALNIRKGATD